LRTIAEHVLDIGQNSVNAGSKNISIEFIENYHELFFSVTDDGCGMDEEMLSKIFDPFFTTKKKKFGLGLPLLKEYAELTGGYVIVDSKKEIGTSVKVKFIKNIDCQPTGNVADVFATLVISDPVVMWYIHRCKEERCYEFSSREIIDLDLTSSKIIKVIFEHFKKLEETL
jgi:hypothetical protein